MMYPKGHRRLDEEFVRILSREHQLIIVDEGKYFPQDLYDNPNIEHIKVIQPFCNRWELLKCTLFRLNLLIVLFKLRHKNFDRILLLNCHNALYKVANCIPNKKCIIIHHNDIDVLFTNKKYLHQFNKVKEKFRHAFLADYISENFVREAQIDNKYVSTIHQPIVFENCQSSIHKENLLVGIGNSTDESFIDMIIELDKKHKGEDFANKMILRSKKKKYKGKNIEVITGFLPRDDYEMLYSRAKVSIVNYPSSYVYRYSGIIDDSLAKGLVVYCNDTLCGQYFATKYPCSVKIFKNTYELWNMISEPLLSQPDIEKEKFYKCHSAEYVLSQFNAALK